MIVPWGFSLVVCCWYIGSTLVVHFGTQVAHCWVVDRKNQHQSTIISQRLMVSKHQGPQCQSRTWEVYVQYLLVDLLQLAQGVLQLAQGVVQQVHLLILHSSLPLPPYIWYTTLTTQHLVHYTCHLVHYTQCTIPYATYREGWGTFGVGVPFSHMKRNSSLLCYTTTRSPLFSLVTPGTPFYIPHVLHPMLCIPCYITLYYMLQTLYYPILYLVLYPCSVLRTVPLVLALAPPLNSVPWVFWGCLRPGARSPWGLGGPAVLRSLGASILILTSLLQPPFFCE